MNRFQTKPNIETPECPNCGSGYAIRIGDTILPDDDYCPQDSGIYRCGHCQNEYQFLRQIIAQVFSPKASCPYCKSYKTKALTTKATIRYHICLNDRCQKPFKTIRPPNERRSRQVESN